MKKISIVCLFLFCCLFSVFADEKEWFIPLGLPPKAKPRRISGGEGFPPLPLPVTPLRRSERKREPSPAKLIGKVIWGETAAFTQEDGSVQQYADWNLCPDDVQQLLAKINQSNLGLVYGSEPIDLTSFSGDPSVMPVLFFSGTRTIRFSQTQIELLRSYVLKGGMIVFDSIAGSPYFYNSVRTTAGQVFPESPIRVVPSDHPLFNIVHDVRKVKYPKQPSWDTPYMEAIYIGCRTGVLISKYGLGCGWDNHEVPQLSKAVYYDVQSANKIGINLVAYAVAYGVVGREEAKPELFGTLDEKPPTDEFVFAQIRHEGAWNVHPGSAATLLRELRQNTSLRVSLKRIPVIPGKDDLSSFPFLYLSGMDDFEFDPNAVASLQSFLRSAGTLFIVNGMGMKNFDQAVRRELKKILPEANLVTVPPNHSIYSSVFKIDKVEFTPAAYQQRKNQIPYLEGIVLQGDLKVIYSPFDMEAGWQGCEHLLCKGYQPESALKMGINIILYATTH